MYKRVLKKINDSDIDAYLIQNEANRNWLCNKGNYYFPGVILVTKEELFIFTESRNIEAFKKLYSEFTVILGNLEEVKKTCKDLNIKTLGFESNTVSFSSYIKLKGLMDNLELISLSDFIEDIRMIKTDKEIELLQEAVKVSDKSYLEFLNYLKIGLTEIEAKNIFRNILFKNGADDLSFDILLSSGKDTFIPHSTSTDKKIQFGDLVLMDFGVVLNGYCSDTTRTVVMGDATDKQRELYNLVLRAQENALNSIKEGITLKEADEFARKIIQDNISSGCYDYGLGHGIGRIVHEKPRMHPNDNNIMKANTAVSVEPGIYIKGWGGIRIEDVMVVGKESPGRILTTCTKEFTIIK